MFRLSELSLSNRALIALVTVLAAVFGVITMGSLKQELIPSLEFPRISVLSTLQGASPEVVDKQLGAPLSQSLAGVEAVESITSTSRSGVSTISLSFAYGTDLDRARNQVDRAISSARRNLPSGVDPQSFAGSVSDFPVVYLAVSSDQPLSVLSEQLNRLTVPRLLKLDGVRGADVSGASGQYVSIVPRDAELAARGVNAQTIRQSLKDNGAVIPAGTIQEQGKELSLQAGTAVNSLDAVKSLPLKGASSPTTIADVADVSLKDNPATSITRTNGVQTLALSVTKKPEADTVTISHEVRDALPAIEAELGHEAKFTAVFDQAPFIEKSIKDLTTEGLLGLGFAVVIILLFLLSVRSTLVTAISIPLSLLITFIALGAAKYSLNILTLGALTIAIGRVVDDSIVVIENIKRHLSYGESKRTAILSAIREVAGAVTASTLTTVAVFLPIAFVGDIAGELFRPFALTVTIALLASLFVSLTIVPVLAYWFLKGGNSSGRDQREIESEAHAREQRSWLARGYVPVLRGTQRHPVITLIAAVVILAGTFAMVPLLQTDLLGASGQNSMTVRQSLPAGTTLEDSSNTAAKVESALKGVDGVQDVQVILGNASTGYGAMQSSGTSDANFTVTTDEKKDQAKLQDAVRRALDGVKDAGKISVGQQQGGFGNSSTVDVTISSGDPQALSQASDKLLATFTGIPGTTGVTTNLAGSVPVVQVSVDRAKAAALGLTEQQIGGLLAANANPPLDVQLRLGVTDYPVRIGTAQRFTSVQQLKDSTIPGTPLPLSAVATVNQVEVPTSITSSNGQRTAVVSVAPEGGNLGAVSAEVQKRLNGVTLPAGTTAALGGATTQQASSFSQLGLALLAAVAIVYVIMVAAFKSLVQPLILLVSIPFAATGAIALLLASGVPLGLPALIGMLMLVGIVVTNAIVLIDLINQYRRPAPGREALSVPEAIEHGARRRLRPILMTAAATVFALTPMALGLTGGGGFISQPLAIVVIGGLVSSTLLTLVLVPVLYRLVEGTRERRRERKAQERHLTPAN
ncbi:MULTISPECIES: efflux RND transporter permease subunit [Arthrobacter]|uniref:Efflux RND transporter permease subunit n=2 Tax=Arthrobacter TaxID=1663 RepID=A0ABU9KPE1_9MICC|nr:efflux RND transporter permease subunit [Arthrobacter sp. YJM1]MDP5228686.1 efflux RND transporter permease subunit [Arthrobacter sp. YJM1]